MRSVARTNTEIFEDVLRRYGETGEPPWEHYADDLVFETRGEMAGRQEHHGHDGFRRALADYAESWADMRPELLGISEPADGCLLAEVRWHLRAHSGVELAVDEHWVVRMRDDKIARLEQYATRDEALAASG